jgi:hypothetical protein
LFKRFLDRLVIKTVMRHEVCIFAGKHCTLEIRRNSVEWKPDLLAPCFLTFLSGFVGASVDQRS